MKLLIFNGSPRGQNSNSTHIISWLLDGIGSSEVNTETLYLNKINEQPEYAEKINDADMIIIAHPLYADAMPGIVMSFIEKLQPYTGKLSGKKVGFVIHSGFPERKHGRYLEKYYENLVKILRAEYIGTAVLGDSEGIRNSSAKRNEVSKELFRQLGQQAVSNGKFDAATLKGLGFEELQGFALNMCKAAGRLGLFNRGWNEQMKQNNAYDKRNARPYAED